VRLRVWWSCFLRGRRACGSKVLGGVWVVLRFMGRFMGYHS